MAMPNFHERYCTVLVEGLLAITFFYYLFLGQFLLLDVLGDLVHFVFFVIFLNYIMGRFERGKLWSEVKEC